MLKCALPPADVLVGSTPVSAVLPAQTQALRQLGQMAHLPDNPGIAVGIDSASFGTAIPLNFLGISHEWPYWEKYARNVS